MSLALGACGASTLPSASTSSPVALELMVRERARAEEAPRALRARLLETLPMLCWSHAPMTASVECVHGVLGELADDLESRPLLFDNATFHEVRAVGRFLDMRDVIKYKARILLDLATIRDEEVTPYQMSEGEVGVPFGRSRLRHLALALLIGSNLYLNDADVHRFFADRLLAQTDDREQLLLVGAARAVFNDGPRDLQRTIVRAWIADMNGRLRGPPDTQSLGLVLSRWIELAQHAGRLDEGAAMRTLVDEVLRARGVFSLTQGIPGAARDLVVLATVASSAPRGRALDQWSPDVAFPSLPGFARAAWALEEPTAFVWPDEVVAALVRDVDGAIAGLTRQPLSHSCYSYTRSWSEESCLGRSDPRIGLFCRLVAGRAEWTPTPDSLRYFDSLAAEREWLPCALTAGLAMGGVPLDVRVKATLQALGEQGVSAFKSDTGVAAGEVLAAHPSWVDRSAVLRAWLSLQGASEKFVFDSPFGLDGARARLKLQPVLDRGVTLGSVSPLPEEQTRARETVARWIEVLRDGLPEFTGPLGTELLLSVVALAPRVALEREAARLVAEVYGRPDVAEWLFAARAIP
jgi:hypothetical protein